MVRWQADLRNTFVFTVFFIGFALTLGLTLAILLDRELFAHNVFRNIFLFPYALSFVVTGVVWRWIFNPETGINLFFDVLGINALLAQIGHGAAQTWLDHRSHVVAQVNSVLAYAWPPAAGLAGEVGHPAGHDAGGDCRHLAVVGLCDGTLRGRHGDHLRRGARGGAHRRRHRVAGLLPK